MQRHVCRDAARGRVWKFRVTAPPCVAPQVSSIFFIGKYAIHSFHSDGSPRRAGGTLLRKIMNQSRDSFFRSKIGGI